MRRQVERRAQGRCEYCRAPQRVTGIVFHIEHIVPFCCGGANALSNLALACPTCNFAKGCHIAGRDPVSGEFVPLFNPRRQRWEDHFQLVRNWTTIRGRTAIGRATVARLQLNSRLRILARLDWLSASRWP
jgi:hypothetical protein